jgi:16S rRNA G966 N2-methylase RsmD
MLVHDNYGKTKNSRFPMRVVNEGMMLVKNMVDPYCLDYSKFVIVKESIYSSLMPHGAKQVADIIEAHFGGKSNINDILDATAHIGCDTINFCTRFGARCISVEINIDAYECLVENKKTFTNVKRLDKYNVPYTGVYPIIYTVHGNCIEFIRGFKQHMDFVYFDPPWGGYNYRRYDSIMLYLEYNRKRIPIYEVVNNVFKEGFTNTVIVKTPKNFDIYKFQKQLGVHVCCKSHPVVKYVKKKRRFSRIMYYITICTITRQRKPPISD